MKPSTLTTTCPSGSLVVVTGAHSFIATHIIDILLKSGFEVRGTVRSAEKASYIESVFHKRQPNAKFSAVVVEDMYLPKALDTALHGASGLVHAAFDLSMTPDFEYSYTRQVEGTKHIFESASDVPTLKRFVLTSAISACGSPKAGIKQHYTPEDWNNYSLAKAHEDTSPYKAEYGMLLYQAAKTTIEKNAQDFIRDRQPSFIYNAILPNINVGPIITTERPQGSGALMMGFFYSNDQVLAVLTNEDILPPQQIVDVRDTARLHVLALTEGDVQNERLISAAEDWTYNRGVEMLATFAPNGHELPQKIESLAGPAQTSDSSRSLELLERVGRSGWSPVVAAMRENCLGEVL